MLPNDLVPGRDRNEVREAFERDGVPVAHQFGHGLFETHDPCQPDHSRMFA